MRSTIILFFIFMIIISCDSQSELESKRIKNYKENLQYYKGALSETLNLFLHKNRLSVSEIDSLLNNQKDKYSNLRLLYENNLIITQKGRTSIFTQDTSTFNFITHESMGSIIGDLISDRKTYRYHFVSYDPNKIWIESKNSMGVIDDAGFNTIESIGDDWYFISGWSVE